MGERSAVEKEQELRNLFYDPMTGYQSRERLYQKAKESGLNVSRREVKEWLEMQDTYTRHKPVIKRHKFQKTYVNDLADQIQLDLVDMSKFSHKNQGYRWILTGIEILSRYGFAVPVQRKDTTHMTEAVDRLLQDFKIGFGKYPNVVQFDDGKEFYNVGVKRLLEGKNIRYFSTKSDRKAAVVERFNRTLKTMMWKYLFKNKTQNWLNVLDKLTDNYNNTKHRSIGMNRSRSTRKTNSRFGKNFLADRRKRSRHPSSKSATRSGSTSTRASSPRATNQTSRAKFLKSLVSTRVTQTCTFWKTQKTMSRSLENFTNRSFQK